jgi:hypothetical protein
MPHATGEVRTHEAATDGEWPAQTQAVTYIGSACVIEGIGEFDLDDLNLVRHQFPSQRVTLDGDVITVWPTLRREP